MHVRDYNTQCGQSLARQHADSTAKRHGWKVVSIEFPAPGRCTITWDDSEHPWEQVVEEYHRDSHPH